MHGGKGGGAPRGNRNAWKHGAYSGRTLEIARILRATSPAAIRRMLREEVDAREEGDARGEGPDAEKMKNERTTPCNGKKGPAATPPPAPGRCPAATDVMADFRRPAPLQPSFSFDRIGTFATLMGLDPIPCGPQAKRNLIGQA
ncbi:hypothetical protein ACFSTI_05690 [Rhizorhabdus histidinilytica]